MASRRGPVTISGYSGAVTQESAANVVQKARTTLKLSSRVQIANSVSNGSCYIRRRFAECISRGGEPYVGKFASGDHFRLIETHPKNQSDARSKDSSGNSGRRRFLEL